MKDANFAGNSKSARDFLGNEWKYECMGCAISNGSIKIPGGKIYEGEYTILGQDPEIPIPGFLIVNVKRHINSLAELTKDERSEVSSVLASATKALKELNIVNEVTVVQEERSKHLHIWIFPNYDWMTRKFGKGITYLRDISAYVQEYATKEDRNKVLEVIEMVKEYFENHDINQ